MPVAQAKGHGDSDREFLTAFRYSFAQ